MKGDVFYFFGGYGGLGVIFDDLYVFCKFFEVLGFVVVDEMLLVRKINWRFFFLVEEVGFGFIEGWCSIKKF